MLATPPRGIRFEVFEDALIRAVTQGQSPSRTVDLDPESRTLIQMIAEYHPEANPALIADAYDAFERARGVEGWHVGETAPIC